MKAPDQIKKIIDYYQGLPENAVVPFNDFFATYSGVLGYMSNPILDTEMGCNIFLLGPAEVSKEWATFRLMTPEEDKTEYRHDKTAIFHPANARARLWIKRKQEAIKEIVTRAEMLTYPEDYPPILCDDDTDILRLFPQVKREVIPVEKDNGYVVYGRTYDARVDAGLEDLSIYRNDRLSEPKNDIFVYEFLVWTEDLIPKLLNAWAIKHAGRADLVFRRGMK